MPLFLSDPKVSQGSRTSPWPVIVCTDQGDNTFDVLFGTPMTLSVQKPGLDEMTIPSREPQVLDAKFSIGGLQDRLFDLLSAIETEGSLVAAAKTAGLSYKGAWDIIERASHLSPRPLIDRNPGGGSDRGTRLTVTGQKLLDIYRRLEQRKKSVLQELNRDLASDPILLQWYRGLILQSSARNQWRAEVFSLKLGVVRGEVTVRLPWGALIIASLTRESISRMALDFGTQVIVLIKAPMVHLTPGVSDFECSAENQFEGVISEIIRDEISTEIIVKLVSGDRVVTTLSADEYAEIGVEEGDKVTLFFDAEAIVLATLPTSRESSKSLTLKSANR